MPAKEFFDGVFYIATVPDISFADGLFHIAFQVGKHTRLEFVLPPAVALKARLLGAEATAKWQLGAASNIHPIGRGKR